MSNVKRTCSSRLVSRLRVASALLNPKPNDRILDIGCGKGVLECNLTKCKNIVGIDMNRKDIIRAKKNASGEFLVASATYLPFKANCLNKIIAAEIIEHLLAGDDKFSLKEMCRVLETDGSLVLTTPSYHVYYNIFDPGWLLFCHKHYKRSELMELIWDLPLNKEKTFERGSIIYAVVMFLHSVLIGFFSELLGRPIPEPLEHKLRLLEQRTDGDFDKDRKNGYTWFVKLRVVRA